MGKKMSMRKKLIIATIIFLFCLTIVSAQDTPTTPFDKIKATALLQPKNANGYYVAKLATTESGIDIWACYFPKQEMIAIVATTKFNILAIEYWVKENRFALYNDGKRVEISKEDAIEVAHQMLLEAYGAQSI
jgi:hypothetical protein